MFGLVEDIIDGNQERRVAPELEFAVDHLGQLVPGLQAILGAGVGDCLSQAGQGRPAGVLAPNGQDGRRVELGVPDVELGKPRESTNGFAVGAHRLEDDRPVGGGVEAAASAGDLQAGGQPLDVPFERPGICLVKVIDVEHQIALGGGEAAEVGEMGVTAQLGPDAGPSDFGEVGGHGKGGAPEIGEGRGGHAAVADRDQLRYPGPRLLGQEVQRVHGSQRRGPLGVARPRARSSGGLSRRRALERQWQMSHFGFESSPSGPLSLQLQPTPAAGCGAHRWLPPSSTEWIASGSGSGRPLRSPGRGCLEYCGVRHRTSAKGDDVPLWLEIASRSFPDS